MASFGVVVPGRPVDTNFQQVDTNKLLITLPNAESINHVVVFLTGVTPMPPDMASCIFLSLPDPSAAPTWNYLGHLTNEKPSAIYKLSRLTKTSLGNGLDNNNSMIQTAPAFNYVQAPVHHVAQIGISIEPLTSVAHMVPIVESAASNASTFVEFINKTTNNLFNYCSSFSRPASELIGNPFQSQPLNDAQFVPLSTIKNWYENYTRRLSNDQTFWRTLN